MLSVPKQKPVILWITPDQRVRMHKLRARFYEEGKIRHGYLMETIEYMLNEFESK